MAKLKIYGVARSRTSRVLWAAEEMGIDYDLVPINPHTEGKAPEYLAINPFGQVPAIDDDGFVLTESMAINLHLAKKSGSDLGPRDLTEDARMTQLSLWAAFNCDKRLLTIVTRNPQIGIRPPDEAADEADRAELADPMAGLDRLLDGKDYLVGGRFTVADINVASILYYSKLAKVDLTPHPNVERWLQACTSRPAHVKVRSL